VKEQRHILLVIDDDPNDQLFIKTALRENGVTDRIFCLSSGQDALAYLNGDGKYANRQEYPFPSGIITDLKMPLVDGFGVLEHIQANPHWRITPTVVLSASADTDDIQKAYQLGVNSFLIKPHEYAALRSLLKLFYDYWAACEVPMVDDTGKQLRTESRGKLGERYRK
jgi:CheY-like chemotaxis protein